MLEVIEEYGGTDSLTYFPNILKQELEGNGVDLRKASTGKINKVKKTVCEKFLVGQMGQNTMA
jgi:hypothetical protein